MEGRGQPRDGNTKPAAKLFGPRRIYVTHFGSHAQMEYLVWRVASRERIQFREFGAPWALAGAWMRRDGHEQKTEREDCLLWSSR